MSRAYPPIGWAADGKTVGQRDRRPAHAGIGAGLDDIDGHVGEASVSRSRLLEAFEKAISIESAQDVRGHAAAEIDSASCSEVRCDVASEATEPYSHQVESHA